MWLMSAATRSEARARVVPMGGVLGLVRSSRVFFMALVLLIACTSPETRPEGVLDRERFKEVLLQAQLIEARANHELIVEHRSRVPSERYYAELFEEQGITEEQFIASYRYYLDDPKELKAIYEEIITELTFRKDRGEEDQEASSVEDR